MARLRYYDHESREIGVDDNAARWCTAEWDCERCGAVVVRHRRGPGDTSCDECGAWYNASGQRLRDDWMNNRSNWDESVSDMDGFEESQLRYER